MIPAALAAVRMIPAALAAVRMIPAALAAVRMIAVALAAAAAVPQAAARCPPSVLQRIALPATRAALAERAPVTIVALGSSSTEGVGAGSPDRTYPARLEAFLRRRWPGIPLTVLNRGVGGETTAQMLARLDRDVAGARPTLVIWQAGANEALQGIDPQLMAEPLREGLRRLAATGADVVLMDNQVAPRIEAAADPGGYDAVLDRVAKAAGVSVFSRTALMEGWLRAGEPEGAMIGADGVHQTPRGYACLAEALSRSIAAASGTAQAGR